MIWPQRRSQNGVATWKPCLSSGFPFRMCLASSQVLGTYASLNLTIILFSSKKNTLTALEILNGIAMMCVIFCRIAHICYIFLFHMLHETEYRLHSCSNFFLGHLLLLRKGTLSFHSRCSFSEQIKDCFWRFFYIQLQWQFFLLILDFFFLTKGSWIF